MAFKISSKGNDLYLPSSTDNNPKYRSGTYGDGAPLTLPQSDSNSTPNVHDDIHSMSADSPFASIPLKRDSNLKLPKGVVKVIDIETRTPSWKTSKDSNARKNALKTENHRPRHIHYRSVTPPDLYPAERLQSRKYKPRKLDPPQTGCKRSGSTNSAKPREKRKRIKMTRSKSNVIDATRTGRPYHEKQEWEFCLKHALNALFGREEFTTADMDTICNQLAPDKLINPHKSIFRTGNYDANVLMMALHKKDVDVQWFDSRKAQSDLSLNDDFLCPKEKYAEFLGFIVNNQQKKMFVFNRRHWLTIKRIEGVWYNLDSKNEDAEPWKEEELLKWLKSACKNDAQLMICRKRLEKEEESKEDASQSMMGSNSKKKRYDLRNRNVIQLETPSQTDLDDSETSDLELEDNGHGSGYGHVYSKSSCTVLPSVDASVGLSSVLDASDGFKSFKQPSIAQHISAPWK